MAEDDSFYEESRVRLEKYTALIRQRFEERKAKLAAKAKDPNRNGRERRVNTASLHRRPSRKVCKPPQMRWRVVATVPVCPGLARVSSQQRGIAGQRQGHIFQNRDCRWPVLVLRDGKVR